MNNYTDKDINFLYFMTMIGFSLASMSFIISAMAIGPKVDKLEDRISQIEKVDDDK